ncbi:unnamed protein product [Parascedosporium putredinis]|uniref:Uncharacterized protein n=1 Tax=Parascedosporium putredinis TaxID=1442378 RepID=A0A9P1MBL0_9PEZI|nr:unnamed protein product [Parascedosporium putredinis]CAI7998875.1 unnamed protein product [Parascedosporium putredinis]
MPQLSTFNSTGMFIFQAGPVPCFGAPPQAQGSTVSTAETALGEAVEAQHPEAAEETGNSAEQVARGPEADDVASSEAPRTGVDAAATESLSATDDAPLASTSRSESRKRKREDEDAASPTWEPAPGTEPSSDTNSSTATRSSLKRKIHEEDESLGDRSTKRRRVRCHQDRATRRALRAKYIEQRARDASGTAPAAPAAPTAPQDDYAWLAVPEELAAEVDLEEVANLAQFWRNQERPSGYRRRRRRVARPRYAAAPREYFGPVVDEPPREASPIEPAAPDNDREATMAGLLAVGTAALAGLAAGLAVW